jgi:hypothetical protein
MINTWISELESAIKKLQQHYSSDIRTIINEDDLKYGIRENLEISAAKNDMLIKSEVPWYERDSQIKQVKFYFDLAILKKSIFNLEFRNASLNNKGYYYDDISIAIMLKFAKPNFKLAEIGDDLNKLKLFCKNVSDDVEKQKPYLIIACSDKTLYDSVSAVLANELKKFNNDYIKRVGIIIFSPCKIEIL